MRIDSKKYSDLMKKQKIDKADIERITGIKPHTMDWILEHGFVEFDTLHRLAVVVNIHPGEILLADYNSSVGSENVIEWLRDDIMATLTLSQRAMISRVKELATKRPQECSVVCENADGSILARIPREWVRINPSLELTEGQRAEMAKRARERFGHK